MKQASDALDERIPVVFVRIGLPQFHGRWCVGRDAQAGVDRFQPFGVCGRDRHHLREASHRVDG